MELPGEPARCSALVTLALTCEDRRLATVGDARRYPATTLDQLVLVRIQAGQQGNATGRDLIRSAAAVVDLPAPSPDRHRSGEVGAPLAPSRDRCAPQGPELGWTPDALGRRSPIPLSSYPSASTSGAANACLTPLGRRDTRDEPERARESAGAPRQRADVPAHAEVVHQQPGCVLGSESGQEVHDVIPRAAAPVEQPLVDPIRHPEIAPEPSVPPPLVRSERTHGRVAGSQSRDDRLAG